MQLLSTYCLINDFHHPYLTSNSIKINILKHADKDGDGISCLAILDKQISQCCWSTKYSALDKMSY